MRDYEGTRIRVSPRNRCPLCGSPDYCMIMDYGPESGKVYWCRKTQNKGDIIVRGKTYSYICTKDQNTNPKLTDSFNLYREKEVAEYLKRVQKEKWIEQKMKENPAFACRYMAKHPDYGKSPSTLPAEPVALRESSSLQKGEEREAPLSNKELDMRYRYFLSLLVLEEKHRKSLLEEWDTPVYPTIGKELLRQYPIRSLPPIDKIRFSKGFTEKIQNSTRKSLVKKMCQKFGTCRGIPGFFLRTGSYWDKRPEEERWTFLECEGILFPAFDADGYLYRLRLKDDYPVFQMKDNLLFHGREGDFAHGYDADGNHTWTWYPKEEGEKPRIVYGVGIKSEITLKDNMCPTTGKPQGKYKAFATSKGCYCGAAYSVYGMKPSKIVLFTEGEKKGMVAAHIKKIPSVCIPGVGNWGAIFEPVEGGSSLWDRLMQNGMKVGVLCYDADKSENPNVAKAEKNFLEHIKEVGGVKPFVGEWSGHFDKGLDDILLMGLDFKLKDPFT